MKKLEKYPRFQEVFEDLGNEWSLKDSTLNELEKFVCIMYGYVRLSNVDEVRVLMLKKMVGDDEVITEKSKVDLSRLSPCRKALYQHFKCVKYRVAQWKRAKNAIVDMPPATDHGWIQIPSDESAPILEPYWSDGPVLPPKMVDILVEQNESMVEENLDGDNATSDEMNDLNDLLNYLYDDSDSDSDEE